MAKDLNDLKPSLLWKHFQEFLKIPHCSGNEKAIGDYIISVAKRLNLDYKRDKIGNVVVSKKASKGNEDAVGVILQGHLDMVCEKNSDVEHDFTKDPIQAEIDGDWVKAKGTTLGADNGIGGSACLAIMETDDIEHPPLEFLFTVEEETGLDGATQISEGFLKGKKLLNLDSEDEGEFTIGCAGGADTQIFVPFHTEKKSCDEVFKLKLSGFKGGHSGIDINMGRGNAIKLLSRILWKLSKNLAFQLFSIKGGNLRNAIPREAEAVIGVNSGDKDKFKKMIEDEFNKIKSEYKPIEPDAQHSFEEYSEDPGKAIVQEAKNTIINLILSLPHGVVSMHPEIEGLVETSTNLAVVKTEKNKIQIVCSTRSSTGSALEATRDAINAIAEMVDAEIIREQGYPGWKPNLESELLKKMKKLYKDTFNKEPHVAAVHAGLECGIIGEKFPGMDMISFGPTIEHPHSPDERVHIGTVEKFWKFLIKVLAELT
ncbi:MAG: aminoacyl-histidine dipeptidase [Candidatus Aminicenantes bacterium]|nr:aminoacyl-histidine dipeptidase [Candidatus Aminicenantes bacterium]